MTATALTPVCTFFDPRAMRSGLLTVPEWRRFSRRCYNDVAWATAARKYAAHYGGALVMRADDSLTVFTRRANGKVSRSNYKPGKWRWDR